MLTTKKIGTGQFQTFWNGQPTRYTIGNGSLGTSGKGSNVYGICWMEGDRIKARPIGTLAACKALVADKRGGKL